MKRPRNAAWLDKPKVPIPIRENHTVLIVDLPTDLTPAEAERIARVVKALAVQEPNTPAQAGDAIIGEETA